MAKTKLFTVTNLRVFVFVFTFAGYGIVGSVVPSADASRVLTIPYRAVTLGLSLLLLLYNFSLISRVKKPVSVNRLPFLLKKNIVRLLLLFVSAYSLRLLYDTLVVPENLFKQPVDYWLFWFLIIIIPGLNMFFLDKAESPKYFFWTWAAHGFIGIRTLLMDPSQTRFYAQSGRLAATAINPISLGHYGASLALLGLFGWLNYRKILPKKRAKILNFACITSMLLGVIVVMLASSRGPFLALLSSVFILIIRQGKRNFRTFLLLLLIVLSAVAGTVFSSSYGTSFFERLFALGDELEANENGLGRANLYSLALRLILQNPLMGTGIEMPGHGYPHNLFLEGFLPLGILGGILFAWLMFRGFVLSIRSLTGPNQAWGWVGLLFIERSVGSMFSGSLNASYTFWYLLFSVLALTLSSHTKKHQKEISAIAVT